MDLISKRSILIPSSRNMSLMNFAIAACDMCSNPCELSQRLVHPARVGIGVLLSNEAENSPSKALGCARCVRSSPKGSTAHIAGIQRGDLSMEVAFFCLELNSVKRSIHTSPLM